MNILHVIPFCTPLRGGSVVVLHQLCKELANQGHNVTIITTDLELDNKFTRLLEGEGIEIVVFECLLKIGLFLYTPK
jgi:hypothetical protein